MNARAFVWTTAGDTEWTARGPIRASLTRVLPATSGTVSVCVRISEWTDADDEGTPAYFHFAAGRLEEEIRALKRRIELHLATGADDQIVGPFLAPDAARG